ncbi:MAG: hypothetical protein M3457_22595 [Chloroflexota bacterium]|nr:hypothetical protein [Chloroflexota bacterium]
MKLAYRMHTKDDEPALIRLWSEHGGWDKVDTKDWAHRLLQPPFGPSTIALAEDVDTGDIVAQFAFIPWRVSVDGHDVRALRAFAPVFAKPARSLLSSVHPIVEMYRYAARTLGAQNERLIYTVPDPRWMHFLRMFPVLRSGTFPLWSLPLPLTHSVELGQGYAATSIEANDQRIDGLWKIASRLYGCMAVRDSRALPWKVSHGNYRVTGVERGGELVGVVAAQQKGDRQWLVCDLLAADAADSLRATLVAAANVGQSEAVAAPVGFPIHKVAVLATPIMEPVLRDLDFARDAYDFPLMVHILDSTIARKDVDPARWYVSAND